MAGPPAERRGGAAPGRPRRPRPDPDPRPRLHRQGRGRLGRRRWRSPTSAARSTELAVFEGASSGLLSDEDLDEAGGALEPGTSAALLVFENTWAGPFASAVRRSGGQLVASGRIPVQAVLAALDAAEANRLEKETTMPGLLRGVARTAVIAGTATTVSNRVSRRQGERWAQQEAAASSRRRRPPRRRRRRPATR